MPSYIVKVHPDKDEYVYWSTIVDAPLFLGNREDLRGYLLHDAGGSGGEAASPGRFERADKTGTSSMDGFYDWDDKTFIVEQRGVVKREDLPELARCMSENKPYPHLLHPFEDGHMNAKWD
jgi:hypothetical protein